MKRILLTGGTGRLGKVILSFAPDIYAPSRKELDILKWATITETCHRYKPDIVIHAAALANAVACERNPASAKELNILGTILLAAWCRSTNTRLVHISTDYVFGGDDEWTFGYHEECERRPLNVYGQTKAIAEDVVRKLVPQSLVVRAPFRAGPPFPYKRAFGDMWTSARYAFAVAMDVLEAAVSELTGVIHIGGPRMSILELARLGDPNAEYEEASRLEPWVGVKLPRDVSLDSNKWKAWRASKQHAA